METETLFVGWTLIVWVAGLFTGLALTSGRRPKR
jgi:hypothetical protein